MSTGTDLQTAFTAIDNTYVHEGIAANFFQDARNKLALATPDVAGAAQDLADAETHVAYMAYQSAAAETAIKAVEIDVAPTPPPPPVIIITPTGKPIWCNYHANTSGPNATVPVGMELDYGDGTDGNTYSLTPQRISFFSGKTPLVKFGDMSPSQATAAAQVLAAGKYKKLRIGIMTEGNQDVAGWYTPWNESSLTATQFIAKFLAIVDAMDAVFQPLGIDVKYCWCPNVNNAGNQKSGRNQFDTWPGLGPNNNIVVAPDGYDYSGDTGSQAPAAIATYQQYETFATSVHAVFLGTCESGANASDDPAYWTDLLTHAEANGWEFVTNFAITKAQGGSFDSTMGPNSAAAVEAFYAS